MLAFELIQPHIIHLEKGEHPLEALTLLRSSHLDAMVVVDRETKFPVCTVTESDLINLVDTDQALGSYCNTLAVMANSDAHIFDIIRLFQAHKSKVLPVVDSEHKYIGTITKEAAYSALSEMLNTTHDGAVISILIRPENYVFSDIIRSIEEEKVKVLGTTVEMIEKPESLIRLSLKIDQDDTKRVIASLRRYDLIILSNSAKSYEVELSVRADEFLHFLNI